jgi:hypothetical protein
MSTKKKQTGPAALIHKRSQYDWAWKDITEELLEPSLEFYLTGGFRKSINRKNHQI